MKRSDYVRFVKATAASGKMILEIRFRAFVFSPSDKSLLACSQNSHMKSHRQRDTVRLLCFSSERSRIPKALKTQDGGFGAAHPAAKPVQI